MKKRLLHIISYIRKKVRQHLIRSGAALLLLLVYAFRLPRHLFPQPYATVLESAEGKLLPAKIATDGQWRFPEVDSVPYRFKMSVLQFEDAHSYHHWGVNPVSVVKALVRGVKSGRVQRGGSTLTQQVVRIVRNHQQRTYAKELIEMIWATRLEFRYSEEPILRPYISHVPSGGNIVGLDMVAWRCFGAAPYQLSWAQSATLAVLPNMSSLIFPSKNQQRLLVKCNALLHKPYAAEIIDEETYDLALTEPLPTEPHPIPQLAPHLLAYANKTLEGQRITTPLPIDLRQKVSQIVVGYYSHYSQSEIYNMAALVVEVKTRKVLAYVGDTPTGENHQKDVGIIHAPRSTGNVLKPFLYVAMLHEGELLPTTLIPNVPTQIAGYSPQDFSSSSEGAVSANMALAKSLNVPFVWLLRQFTIYCFHEVLQKLRLKNISRHPDHYGLSIILGRAESNLWDLAQAYTNLVSEVNVFAATQQYRSAEFQSLSYMAGNSLDLGKAATALPTIRAGALYSMFSTMKEVNRPTDDVAWRYYESARKIAWKTGTSSDNRDAWVTGATPEYVVTVWVDNAIGEGGPTLTGVSYAAPVMSSIFNVLPYTTWFQQPLSDMREVTICEQPGYLAKPECPQKLLRTTLAPKEVGQCLYHKLVHLTPNGQYQINASCQLVDQIYTKAWFVLPPVMEWYYKQQHIHCQSLSPSRSDCTEGVIQKVLGFMYPKHLSAIYITKSFGGEQQPFVAKVANRSGKLLWYIDDVCLDTTDTFHEMNIFAAKGEHLLKIINEKGDERTIKVVCQ